MKKHTKAIIAAAMSVTMMAAAAAPAGSMLAGISPIKAVTASANLSGEYETGTRYDYTDGNGNVWKYCLNSAKTAACIWQLRTIKSTTVTVPNRVPKQNGTNQTVPVRAIDYDAIYGTSKIEHLILSANLQKLDVRAIHDLSNLNEITIKGTLTSIQSNSLFNCSNLWRVYYEGTSFHAFELFNDCDIEWVNGFPLYQCIAGNPIICPYDGIADYIDSRYWIFEGAKWMNDYLLNTAYYQSTVAKRLTDGLTCPDTKIISNICDYVSGLANNSGTRVSNNVKYNGDTAFFFNASQADSLGCAKAFDLIARAAGFECYIKKAATSINNPYEYLNVLIHDGYVYTIDAMHGSCMESYKKLNSRFGGNLPSRRWAISAAELNSTIHGYSGSNSEYLAVPYRFRGDLDNSNSIYWTDCNIITDYLNGARTLTAAEKFQADFNMDGSITYADVQAMQSQFSAW